MPEPTEPRPEPRLTCSNCGHPNGRHSWMGCADCQCDDFERPASSEPPIFYVCSDFADTPCCGSCNEDVATGHGDGIVMRLNGRNVWLCCRHIDAAKAAGATYVA